MSVSNFGSRKCNPSLVPSNCVANSNNYEQNLFTVGRYNNQTLPWFDIKKNTILNINRCNLNGYRYISTEGASNYTDAWPVFNYISQSSPVAITKELIINVHDISGLPWWATIMLITFSLRTFLTLPLTIYQTYILAKVENIALLEMPDHAKRIKKETDAKVRQLKWDKREATLYYKTSLKKQWNTLIVRDNCHPFKATITLWFQIPTWIFFSAALRNLAYMLPVKTAEAQIAYLQLCVGGFMWIPNLTQPDGTLILPFVLGLSNLAIIEIQAMMRMREATRFQNIVTNFFRCFSVALIPISATVPSVLCLYWTTSSLLALFQNLFMMSNKVRSFCQIPDTPSTFDRPYAQLMAEIKEKIFRKI
ncbi:hypothetical protein AAG570_006351 [Ranatra chinensis]|uniref:Mitochondrial inner membrane protein COX18 n=1 Tax=Ranatra chinensis TaxID=642074 RepID=A0ABD0YTU4_9HEMI